MRIKKLSIPQSKFDINLQFYFLQKQLVKAKLSDAQTNSLIEVIDLSKPKDSLKNIEEILSIVDGERRRILDDLLLSLRSEIDLKLFVFSLKLSSIRGLLLQEAKIKEVITSSKLSTLNPLSLEYDKLTVKKPYTTRVNRALLSLIFFSNLEEGKTNFMSDEAHDFIKTLSKLAIDLKKQGLEPNQIFMLMFTESMNQSIISDSGTNYEERILSVLKNIGIPESNIKKVHDKADASTEFDFFFELEGRTYGIGAKRTLRERYKQFIKTAQTSNIDVMIEVTLGIDLNETKAKTIRGHRTYIFVSDEVYGSRKFLQEMQGVYSVKELNLSTLKKLK